MKKGIFAFGFLLVLFHFFPALAQTAAAVTPPAPVALPPAVVSTGLGGLFGTSLTGNLVIAVTLLNIILSAVQQGFAAIHKALPPSIQSISGFVLKVIQFVGSNPTL